MPLPIDHQALHQAEQQLEGKRQKLGEHLSSSDTSFLGNFGKGLAVGGSVAAVTAGANFVFDRALGTFVKDMPKNKFFSSAIWDIPLGAGVAAGILLPSIWTLKDRLVTSLNLNLVSDQLIAVKDAQTQAVIQSVVAPHASSAATPDLIRKEEDPTVKKPEEPSAHATAVEIIRKDHSTTSPEAVSENDASAEHTASQAALHAESEPAAASEKHQANVAEAQHQLHANDAQHSGMMEAQPNRGRAA